MRFFKLRNHAVGRVFRSITVLAAAPASAFAGKEQQRLEQRMFQTLFARQSSIVDKSPVGKLSSHAFKTRRMIFPLRVFGSLSRNSISRGAA